MKNIILRQLMHKYRGLNRIKKLLGLVILFSFPLIFFLLPINSQAADYTSGKSNNILISHRGYYECPENTLLAFETSGQFGYKYLETDIHMTKDNVLVCLHDNTINRTARNKNGTAINKTINIADITYEQALSYDFGIYKGKSQKIPTFEEYIKVCKKYNITPFIEIKECNEIGAKKIAEVLKKYGLNGKSVVLAFRGRLEKLKTVKNYSPNEKYYILADDWYMNNYGESFAEFLKVSKNFGASYIGVYPDQYYKYSNLLKDYTVILYTINNPYRLEEFQVYGITTDSIASDGWKYYNGGFKYYKNGFMYTGWHYMTAKEGEKTPHWSYFGNDGVLRTGWQKLGKGTNNPDGNSSAHWSYFGPNGWLRTGWQSMGKGTANPDGNTTKHWSYFGDNGWLRTGWQWMGKGTSNSYNENTVKHISYFGPNGWIRTGMQDMGRGTNNPDGNAVKHKSYFGNNGWLIISRRFSLSGRTYFADSKGWIR